MGRYRSPSGSGEEYDAWDERSPGSNTRGRTPSRPALSARPAPGTAEYNLNFGQPSRPSAAQGTAFPGASARRQATTQLTTQPGLINPQEVRREALDREVAERLQHEEMENAGSQSGYYGEDGYATDSTTQSDENYDIHTDDDSGEEVDTTTHAPKKAKGDLAYDDGTIDRTSAHINQPDPSKLVIRYPTRRPDGKGGYIKGKTVKRRYFSIDWTSQAEVIKLNAWREQIFRRTFGRNRQTRLPWLISEREVVLDIARRQLRKSSTLKMNRLANEYNKRIYGKTQRAGEQLTNDKGKGLKRLIDEDRKAPWRTVSAIQGQSKKWPAFEVLRNQAKKQRASARATQPRYTTSDDDAENPDPTPNVLPRSTKKKHEPSKRQAPSSPPPANDSSDESF